MTFFNLSSSSSLNPFQNMPSLDKSLSLNELVNNFSIDSIGSLHEPASPPTTIQDQTLVAVAATPPTTSNSKIPIKKSTNTKHTIQKPQPRARRIIPDNKEYIREDPTGCDVVSGRGGRANHHPGNRRYWTEVLSSRSAYRACTNDCDKTKIARSIMKCIHNVDGRFLQRDTKAKPWFVLPEKVSLDKIKQALRDKYVPLWARKGNHVYKKVSTPTSRRRIKAEVSTKTKTAPSSKPPKMGKPKKIPVNEDELTEAISTLPSFKTNREEPMQLSTGHSLNPARSIDCVNDKKSLDSIDLLLHHKSLYSFGPRSVEMISTLDNFMFNSDTLPDSTDDLLHKSLYSLGCSVESNGTVGPRPARPNIGTDWKYMYKKALATPYSWQAV